MLPLPSPRRGGRIELLYPYLRTEEHGHVLAVAWMLAVLRAVTPFAILVWGGEQGSGKSVAERAVVRCIDPAKVLLRSPPREERDLYVAAFRRAIVAFDNLSKIDDWLADALCRLATGGGFGKRQNYSDLDEVLIDVTRPIVFNGIPDLLAAADLADRALGVVSIPFVAGADRRPEREIWSDFDRDHPEILGGLLDALVGVLREEDAVPRHDLPRMADFSIVGLAAEAGGLWTPGTFRRALAANREGLVAGVLDSDPIVAPLRALLLKAPGHRWEGSPTDLQAVLDDGVSESQKKHKEWSTARSIRSRLRRLAPALRDVGIEVTLPTGRREGRKIQLSARVPDGSAPPSTQEEECTAASPSSSSSSSAGNRPSAGDDVSTAGTTEEATSSSSQGPDSEPGDDGDGEDDVPSPSPAEAAGPRCAACGSKAIWRSRHGVGVCRICHPPAPDAEAAP
jgi:hypothetical protein